jgi:Arc/MetJ-type ribon-helix-helix transcriptional regulator
MRMPEVATSSSCSLRPPTRSTGEQPEASTARSRVYPQLLADGPRFSLGPSLSIAKCNKWYYHHDMELISVKLPPALRAKIAAEAQRRNVSQSAIVRESLERVLTGPASRDETSCVDLAGSLVGSFRSGRRDLSTNKKLLADAMASNARRGRKRHR